MKYATSGTDGQIHIEFSYDESLVELVRGLAGRRYHPESKHWTCPASSEAVCKLRDWGFAMDPALSALTFPSVVKPLNIANLGGSLYPFQERGVEFLEHKNGRGIIADEMGLGKTVQALAWLQLRQELRPAIILVPASIKMLWKQQAQRWLSPANVEVLYGWDDSKPINADVVIVNYEILLRRLGQLINLKPKVLVIDEIHNIMHSTAKQTRATIALGKHCQHVVGLGGTLILNRPMECYNAVRLIDPKLLPSRFHFGMRYCAGRHNGWGWDFSGASNTPELHKILKRVMIRRLKSEVLPDLPTKVRTVVPLDITNADEYRKAEQDFIQWVLENRGRDAARRASAAEAFTRVEVLKQVAAKGKLAAVDCWVDEYLQSDQKLVMFTTHYSVLDHLTRKLGDKAQRLVGGMTDKQTEKVISSFQNDPKTRVLVGMLDTRGRPAGVGHNLTAAQATAFAELPWSPAICDQAEDRIHRIGQTADSVSAYYLIAAETIESKIASLLDSKRGIVDTIHNGKATEGGSLLLELLSGFGGK